MGRGEEGRAVGIDILSKKISIDICKILVKFSGRWLLNFFLLWGML